MDKLRQKYLQKWLRAQQQPVKKLMRTNIALATLSSLILVVQTYFLATLLDKLIMQHVDRAELIPYFYCINHYFCVACGHFMATRKNWL